MSQLTLLVVDDEESILRSLERTLRHEEYRILKAGNAFEAMATLSKEEVHVIISDFKMPMESGFELLEKVKTKWPHITRIMLTAYTNSSLLIEAINKGLLFRFVDKPWNSVTLKTTIREAMEHSLRSQKLLEDHMGLQNEIKELREKSEVDGLTGLYNHNAILERLEQQIHEAKRYEKSLTVAMVDIDYFKKVNDTFGHQTGDKVLEEVAQTIQSTMRKSDITGRYGGEEFLIILPFTDISNARDTLERLRKNVEELIWKNEDLNTTISIGVSQWNGELSEELIKKADTLLYAAKTSGRNRVSV